MSGAKQLPIAAAVAGILAAIGITIKLAGTSEDSLEVRLDKLLAREKELAASDPFEDLTSRMREFSIIEGVEIRKLPPAKQKQVQNCTMELRALVAYQAFEKDFNEIRDPKTAGSRTQLSGIEFRLRHAEVPTKLPDAVKFRPAVQRRQEWVEDAEALQVAFQQLEADYSQLVHDAKNVVLTKNEPQLPDRIQKVLTLAKDLKISENTDRFVPGSQRVTYAMVFQLSEIQSLVRDWTKLKEQLEPALKEKSP
jgi:hypothetical protein